MKAVGPFHKLIVIALAVALLLPACASTDSAPDCKSAEVFCVGMLTDVGKVKDQGLNQFTWDAILQAEKELGVHGEYIETTNWKDYDKNIATFGEAGYDLIITVGYNLGDATVKAAGLYPNSMFIGEDQQQNGSKAGPANLVFLSYPEDEAGFLAGALAGQMSSTRKVGGVCSTDLVPMTWRYCEGFKAGATYVDPKLEVSLAFHNDVNNNLAFNDTEWGAARASAMIKKGADVIFGAGGLTGNGAVTAAAQMGIYTIAADSDQYDNLPDARKMLLTSVIKLVTQNVYDLIKLAFKDKFPVGNYIGGIAYAPYHDLKGAIPAKVKERMKQIAQGLADGSIKTNVSAVKP